MQEAKVPLQSAIIFCVSHKQRFLCNFLFVCNSSFHACEYPAVICNLFTNAKPNPAGSAGYPKSPYLSMATPIVAQAIRCKKIGIAATEIGPLLAISANESCRPLHFN
jgi:hypothetical protein